MANPFDISRITPDTIVQVLVVLVALLTLVVSTWDARRRERQIANRQTYQQLELAAIDLFRFEADHVKVIRPLWEKGASLPDRGSAEGIVFMNYVCQMLNLFEMAIRFRRQGVMSPQVFGSWISWFFLLCSSPGFGPIWRETRLDYTPDLRNVMDFGIAANSVESGADARTAFYQHVGKFLKCRVILGWLSKENSYSDDAA